MPWGSGQWGFSGPRITLPPGPVLAWQEAHSSGKTGAEGEARVGDTVSLHLQACPS